MGQSGAAAATSGLSCSEQTRYSLLCRRLQNIAETNMGNSYSGGSATDANEVLVHSFQLDTDHSMCSCPFLCAGRTAHFPVPRTFSSHLETFIPLAEGKQLLEDLNRILRSTHWSIKYNQCGPIMVMLCLMMLPFEAFMAVNLASLAMPNSASEPSFATNTVYSLALSVVPMVGYFILFIVQKRRRKSQLTGYVDNWNRSKANGVTLSFGGGGTFVGKGGRTTQVGSQTGGNYETFYMSTWDWQGLMLKAYLHVIVHYQARYEWCQANGVQFVPPVSHDQQSQGQRLPPAFNCAQLT